MNYRNILECKPNTWFDILRRAQDVSFDLACPQCNRRAQDMSFEGLHPEPVEGYILSYVEGSVLLSHHKIKPNSTRAGIKKRNPPE